MECGMATEKYIVILTVQCVIITYYVMLNIKCVNLFLTVFQAK